MVGVPLLVHYWADLQSVHGFRCYDNIAPNAKCERVLVLGVWLFAVVEARRSTAALKAKLTSSTRRLAKHSAEQQVRPITWHYPRHVTVAIDALSDSRERCSNRRSLLSTSAQQ